jgi:pyruvate,water dikinase
MGSYGAKADNLKRLSDAGYNVPEFYVVPQATKLSDPKVRQRIETEFAHWAIQHNITSVAVRSSSTQEDTHESSFAGQFTTVLGVTPDDLVDALNRVFSSKQSRAYSTKTGHVHAIIQRFVEPAASGVVFSINPASGNDEIVINAALGRGTKVVGGEEADQYFVDRLDARRVTIKPGGSKFAQRLAPEAISQLVESSVGIERLFGWPQDIEWAVSDNQLYILQARPITKINHLRLWDSSNIAESFPGIVLPLTFSIARKAYMLGYKSQAQAGGLSWYEIEANHRTFDAMIGIFNGRPYYNLLNWYRYISLFPGNTRNQKFLDDQIATQGQAVYLPRASHSAAYKLRFYFRLARRSLYFHRILNKFYADFRHFEADMDRLPQDGDSHLLIKQYSLIEQLIIPQFGRTLDNDFIVMVYHGWLKKLLSKWLPDKPFEKNSIIGSITGVQSAEQALTLHRIADAIKADPRCRDLLETEAFAELKTSLKGSAIEQEINGYVEVFGHRFAQDQKIEAPNPMLEPLGIFKVLKTYAKLDGSEVARRIQASRTVSQDMEKQLIASLSPGRKLIYRWLLKHLKRHLRLREKNRLLRGQVWGYMRTLFPKLGQALVEIGAIKAADDIHYLQIDEIYDLLNGALPVNDLTDRIDRRRRAYKSYAKIEMPERFMTTGVPSLEIVQTVTPVSPQSGDSLSGLISSPGTVEGKAIILDEPVMPDEPYDILIAKHTDPGWTPLIALAKGVIVEHGGMLSHAAIVTRELGIPSIIGVQDVTKIVHTGDRVRINTQQSCVEILKSASPSSRSAGKS